MYREIDERVGQPPREQAMVVLTHSPGQRLQRRAQSRAADLVESPADRDHAVIGVGDGQVSRLDAIGLFLDDPRGISRMTGVNAGLAKLGHALLARVAQERGLVKALANRGRSLGDVCEVRKPDLA